MERELHKLVDLGLTKMEATVYLQLLREPEPQTAYAIGKRLGRATANVYAAVESLQHKGAVTVSRGDRRLCRAVPPRQFLAAMTRQFERQRDALDKDLARWGQQAQDERVTQLRSAAAVLQQAADLIAGAQTVLIVDAFPLALEELRDELLQAASRGVQVRLQHYGAPESLPLPPALNAQLRVVRAHQAEEILAHWRAQQLNVVADGREALIALLSEDLSEVHEAVHTNLLYLSCMLHAGFSREHQHHAAQTAAEATSGPEPREPHSLVREASDALYFHRSRVPGQNELAERFADPWEEKDPP